MTRAIRRLSLVLALLLVALLANLTFIQVFKSDTYRNQADNKRVILVAPACRRRPSQERSGFRWVTSRRVV